MKPSLSIQPTGAILVEKVAARIIELAKHAVETKGNFSIALSGGSTPKTLYAYLANDDNRDLIPWDKVHIFFGDERAVAPDDPLANYRMVREAMLDRVPIPAENVHRMKGESGDLEEAAAEYQKQMEKFAPLDLVLLGMGHDGHTASLFPNSPVLTETKKLCAATPVASLEPHVRRLTITFPSINTARRVWVLLTGAGKAEAVEQVYREIEDGDLHMDDTPIQGVQPRGKYIWWLDAGAAGKLPGRTRVMVKKMDLK